jgi:tRNA A-37 threonylcarbamoyl transferase component Bud32
MRNVVLYARTPDYRALIERADQLIASASFQARKSEGRTLAGVVEAPGVGPVFIKRVEVSSWIYGLAERIRGSRAVRSTAGAKMLGATGINHPELLAAMDVYAAGAIRASYVVSRALLEADTLSRFALGPGRLKGRDVHRRKRISDAVAVQVRRLHDSGLYTRDLQETNLMVEETAAHGFKIYFVDLEDFRRIANVSWHRRLLNLIHLDRSVGRFLCRAARLDFLFAYLAERPGRAEIRKIISEIAATRAKIDNRKRRLGAIPAPAPASGES